MGWEQNFSYLLFLLRFSGPYLSSFRVYLSRGTLER